MSHAQRPCPSSSEGAASKAGSIPEAEQALMPRATIYELEANRHRAIEAMIAAYDQLDAAHALARAAAPSGRFDLPALPAPAWPGGDRDEHQRWAALSPRDRFQEDVTRRVDRGVWSHLVAATRLDQLMDRTERAAFHRALNDNPPPATAENCLATIERLLGDADLIFKRGISKAFSSLDRRFRSHDGFKIGSRVVLNYAFDRDGWPHSGVMDTLYDVERTFLQLDGRGVGERYAGVIGLIDQKRRGTWGPQAYEVEGEYFRVCVYKKGTAHLWFTRKDLVLKVNDLLADYYGANLGVGPDKAEARHSAAATPATSGPGGFGFFPSPEPVVREVMRRAGLYRREDVSRPDTFEWRPVRVLEPSAGGGALANWAAMVPNAAVTCVEIQPHLAAALAASGRFAKVAQDDFLNRTPEELGRFDVIIMNPPFDSRRDVDHVAHALGFLAEGGVLVAVMAAGVEFREDRKTADFRREIERRGGTFFDLPPGSFAESGTWINTVLCCVGRRYWS